METINYGFKCGIRPQQSQYMMLYLHQLQTGPYRRLGTRSLWQFIQSGADTRLASSELLLNRRTRAVNAYPGILCERSR